MTDNITPGVFVKNGLLFRGPSGETTMVFGYMVDAPELRLAGFTERNKFKSSQQQLLQLLAVGETLEFHWGIKSNFEAEFAFFDGVTQKAKNPAIRDVRQRTLALMRQHPLRRHELHVFLQTPVSAGSRTSRRQRRSPDFIQTMVSTHEPKGSQFGERLDAVLRECGGNACQMSETELFQLFHERFNPPVECHPTLDFAALLDPENSILKHCWRSDIRGQGGQGFAMGHYYFKPLVLERPPTYTYPTIIQPLLDQPFGDYCITVKLRRVSADSMVAREQKELDRTNQLLSAKEDERAAVTRAKREERVRGLSQGDLVPIVLEFYVLAWDRTPQGLSHKVLSLESAIHAMQGAQIYSADLPTSATKYFFKSLPGPMADHLRGIELYAEDTWATDLLPISTTATGHLDCAHAMYLGASGAPVGVVTSTGKGRDSMILHSAWFGGSGMGKSVALIIFCTKPTRS